MEATDKSPPAVNGGHITYAEAQIQSLAKFPEENPSPVLRVDKDGAVLYANPPGKAILEAWGASVGRAVPNDWRKVIKEVLASGHTAVREMQVQDRILSLTLAPITASGYVNLYGRDITRQKQADTVLRESEQRMQRALQLSRSFAFEWDTQTDRIRRSDSCDVILGVTGDAARHDTGQGYFQRVHPDDREGFVGTLNGLTPAADTYHVQYRATREDGAILTIAESGQGYFDAAGKLIRVVGICMDITARKQAEEAMQDSNEELQRFNRLAVDREMRMIELKNEINALCAQTGLPPRYAMDARDGTPVIAANGSAMLNLSEEIQQ